MSLLQGEDSPRDELSAGDLQARAVKGAFWTVIHVLVSVPIAFAVNALVARALGVAEYGALASLSIVIGVVAAASNLGVSDGVIQWGAAAYAKGDRETARALVRRSLGYHVLVQFPLLVLAVVIIARDFGPWIIACLVLSLALPVALGSAALTITIENRSAANAKIAMFTNLVTQMTVACVAVTASSAVAVWTARSLTPSLVMPLNLRALDRPGRRNALRLAMPRRFPEGFWRYSVLTAAGGLLGMLVMQRTEVVVLRGFDAVEAAGLFALGAGIAAQITAPVDALLNPIRPAVAGLVAAHPERAAESLLRITRVSALVSAGVAVTAVPLLFVLIPVIYGGEFEPTRLVFVALGLTSCLQSVLAPLTSFTNARKRSGTILKANVVAVCVDLGLAFALVPTIGLWGAVVANIAAQITALAPLAFVETRSLDIPIGTYLQSLVCFIVPAAVTGSVIALSDLAHQSTLVNGVAASMSGLAALVLVSRLWGAISQDEEASLMASMPVGVRRPLSVALAVLLSSRQDGTTLR